MKWGLGEIDTFVGDVWELATEAFISPIHCEMRPAGQLGVDLLRRAGPDIERDLLKQPELTLGQAFVSESGSLDCEKLIHIAVSTLSRRPTIEAYEEAMHNALMIAYRASMRSLAIPATYIEPGEILTSVLARRTVHITMDHLKKARFPGRIVLVVPTDYVHKVFLAEIDRIRFGELPK